MSWQGISGNGGSDIERGAPDTVCAIVVTYFPDNEFNERLRALLPQVAQVVVVDNTPESNSTPCLAEVCPATAQVHLIKNETNKGISVALNQGLEYALRAGCRWILTLDQDTHCYPDMVDTLLRVARACQPQPAVVGGNYLDLRNQRHKVPASGPGDFLTQKTVITSGSLVNAGFAAAIGGFREDYFIDQVDHEFCLRARAHGRKVVITRKPVMVHSVGKSGGVRVPFLGILPNHPPQRKYYIARNTVVTVATYWRVEPQWCVRRLARLLLGLAEMAVLEEHRASKVLAFAAGVADGVRRRMGPCLRESILSQHPDQS